MLPNVIAAITHKEIFANNYANKTAFTLEHIGRIGCIVLMIINLPYTFTGFLISYGKVFYLAVNFTCVAAYLICWALLWNKDGIVKSLLLSIIPSFIFLFSGIMIVSIPLIIFALIFSVCHILISVKNTAYPNGQSKVKIKSLTTVLSIILAIVMVFACTFGGLTIYSNNLTNALLNMSASEMIAYDCKDKDTKISIAIIENGNITYKTYGSDGEEDNIYDYEIGSISKTFVGLLCAKAVSEGKLNLSDSISKYLNLDDDKYYPTIERLITHTSGYDSYYFNAQMVVNAFSGIDNDFYGTDEQALIDKVKEITLEDKDYPFLYSNFGISLVGIALQNVYGDSFTNIMNDFISNTLNLNDTAVAKQSGNLNGYWSWQTTDGYIPAGAIISNIKDMASYLNIYLTDSLPYAADTYSPLKSLNANAGDSEKFNIRIDGIGMTWILDNKNDIVWHNGATTNFNSYMGFTKDKTKGVVVLGNLSSNSKIPMSVIATTLLTSTNTL
jgi:CubicO group peptidase (beta-lactamase class C family)